MKTDARTCIGAVAAAFMALAPVSAQSTGVLYTVILPAGQFGSPQAMGFLLGGISAAKAFCSKIQDEYVVDCLAERLAHVADQVPEDGDYAEFDRVLNDTSDKLQQLARSNRDRTLRAGRATTGGEAPITTTRPLVPVSAANATAVNQQARAILDEAETVLLRSAAESLPQRQQYAQLAEAVGSTKVLLQAA